MAGKILEAELIIKGQDNTGPAFAGVIKHAEELKAALGGMQGMRIGGADFAAANAAIKEQTSLLRTERVAAQEVARSIAAGNAALVERTGLLIRLHKQFQGIANAGGVGWMVGGIASGRAAKSIAHDAADFEHQKAVLGASGMTKEEIERAISKSYAMRVPGAAPAENLKTIGELRMVFGSTDHAIDHATTMQRATAILKSVNPHMDAENESYNLARALEIKGVSNDPEHFTRLANMMVQALNASRGKVTGTEFFEFTKYSRGAAGRLSDEFYTRIAPTLIQELAGHSAGMALASFRQTLVGGKMTNRATEEFVKLGLVDPKSVIRTKTGSVKGVRPGGLIGSGLASENPFDWVQQYLAPALKQHGITDSNRVSEELAHLFGNRFSEQMASILLNQSQRILKDAGLDLQAPGIEALDRLRDSDPTTAANDLGAGIKGLLGALGGPLVQPAIASMNKLSGWARDFAQNFAGFAKSNPMIAEALAGGGALGLGFVGFKGLQSMFGLFTGAGALRGSAAALTGSAASLNAAAARLGGASIATAAGGGGAVVAGSSVAGLAASVR